MILSAVLKQEGHEVYVKDGSFTKKRDILEFMKLHKVDVVGVSCVSYNFERAIGIIEEIKKEFPFLNDKNGKFRSSDNFTFLFYTSNILIKAF